MGYWKNNIKHLKESMSIKVIYTFLLDIAFYLTTFFLVLLLVRWLSGYYDKVESMFSTVNPLEYGNALLLQSSMNQLYFRSIIVIVGSVLITFILYVLFKGMIYSILSKRDYTIEYIKKFSLFSLFWFVVLFFPLAFFIMFMLFAQQLGAGPLTFSLIISEIGVLIILFFVMISNHYYSRHLKFSTLKKSFSSLIDIRRMHFPIISLFVFTAVIFYLWGYVASILVLTQAVFFNVYGLLILFILSWFRYYIGIILR